MEKYIGVKRVLAVPMSYNEAIEKGYRVNDKTATEGYEVEYEDGYKSWSPKDVFDKAYIQDIPFKIEDVHLMKPHEQRVINEYEELVIKYNALFNFIGTDLFYTLTIDEQGRLKFQSDAMNAYLNILAERAMHFKKD